MIMFQNDLFIFIKVILAQNSFICCSVLKSTAMGQDCVHGRRIRGFTPPLPHILVDTRKLAAKAVLYVVFYNFGVHNRDGEAGWEGVRGCTHTGSLTCNEYVVKISMTSVPT